MKKNKEEFLNILIIHI